MNFSSGRTKEKVVMRFLEGAFYARHSRKLFQRQLHMTIEKIWDLGTVRLRMLFLLFALAFITKPWLLLSRFLLDSHYS
jgi:hypothetical protein